MIYGETNYICAYDQYSYYKENCFTSNDSVLHREERTQTFSASAERKESQCKGFILSMLEEKHVVTSSSNKSLKLPEMQFTTQFAALTMVSVVKWCSKLIISRSVSFSCPEKSQREYIILFIPKNHESSFIFFLSP